MSTNDPAKAYVTECLRAYILTESALRKSPIGWQSRPVPDTPEGEEYKRLGAAHRVATAELWLATDFEYDQDGFRDVVWNWRFWKVKARKCCWYQRFGTTFKAGWTMRQLQKAETRFVDVCGLADIYRTPNSYIEEAFPKLKLE